ncbi:hypothetical protein E3N88_19362 [Mikania micrantha]|uniref:Uncharacterized protein n=1 Tax=Mikania micrantha TaxID=192012 RepID=A0A5N6NMZ0_9ASTR|nr:hypothetical protein E3N88_19362 [Mikania micrantha]
MCHSPINGGRRPSLLSNFVTILHFKERWLKQQQEPSKRNPNGKDITDVTPWVIANRLRLPPSFNNQLTLIRLLVQPLLTICNRFRETLFFLLQRNKNPRLRRRLDLGAAPAQAPAPATNYCHRRFPGGLVLIRVWILGEASFCIKFPTFSHFFEKFVFFRCDFELVCV